MEGTTGGGCGCDDGGEEGVGWPVVLMARVMLCNLRMSMIVDYIEKAVLQSSHACLISIE